MSTYTGNSTGDPRIAEETTRPASAPENSGKGKGTKRRFGKNQMPKWQKLLFPILIPAVVVSVWQYTGSHGLIAGGLFPSASQSLVSLLDWIFGERGSSYFSGTWTDAVLTSTGRVAVGFAIGTLFAIVLGLLGGVSASIRRIVDPSVNAIRPISVTAWVPLALIVFGVGYQPAIFLTALGTFFPVYINTLSGARYSEGKLVQAAQMLGATRWQTLSRVTLPATLPSIAVGMRVGAAIAWTCVVVAEMLGAKSGLGYTLILSYQQFEFGYIVAAMASIGLCGYITDKLLEHFVERKLRWATGNK